jgi:hypothetical protein
LFFFLLRPEKESRLGAWATKDTEDGRGPITETAVGREGDSAFPPTEFLQLNGVGRGGQRLPLKTNKSKNRKSFVRSLKKIFARSRTQGYLTAERAGRQTKVESEGLNIFVIELISQNRFALRLTAATIRYYRSFLARGNSLRAVEGRANSRSQIFKKS